MSTDISVEAKTMANGGPIPAEGSGGFAGRLRTLGGSEVISTVGYAFGTTVVAVLAWHFAVTLFGIPRFLLPDPLDVAAAFRENMPLLLHETGTTAFEIILGFLLSVVVGIPLALAIFLWPAFSKLIYPGLVASQAVPKVAIAPLLVVWFGYGLLPKVLVAFSIAVFPVVINTVTGLTAIEREKLLLARSLGFNGLSTFLKIRLPSAAPNIFGGLKIAITLAVVGAVVGEFVGGNGGLGYQLMVANGSMDTALLFALLITLTLLGVALFVAAEGIERLVVPSHRHAGHGDAEHR